MTQLNLTLNLEEIEAAALNSDMNNTIKSLVILTLNEYMEKERNGYYDRDYILAIGKIQLKVPRTRDGKFSTTLFERYQRTKVYPL